MLYYCLLQTRPNDWGFQLQERFHIVWKLSQSTQRTLFDGSWHSLLCTVLGHQHTCLNVLRIILIERICTVSCLILQITFVLVVPHDSSTRTRTVATCLPAAACLQAALNCRLTRQVFQILDMSSWSNAVLWPVDLAHNEIGISWRVIDIVCAIVAVICRQARSCCSRTAGCGCRLCHSSRSYRRGKECRRIEIPI